MVQRAEPVGFALCTLCFWQSHQGSSFHWRNTARLIVGEMLLQEMQEVCYNACENLFILLIVLQPVPSEKDEISLQQDRALHQACGAGR